MVKKLFVVNVVLLLALLLTGVAYAQDDIAAAANSYFSAGTKNISAADLYDVLNDGDDSNDPFILDTRSAEHYALGHIKGAVSIPFATINDSMDQLPDDQQIVVICYTGQNASQTTSVLNLLGYDATNLLYGMAGWTQNAEVALNRFDVSKVPGYPTTTEAATATETYDAPEPLGDTIAEAAAAFFAGGSKHLKNADLFDVLNDGDDSNDPFLVSVRSAEDYAKGHIEGAVNMDAKTMFSAANLAKLPPDRQIVVNCYSGQTSSQVISVLRMLGYDAWSLHTGMMNWSDDPDVYVRRYDVTKIPDYPFEGSVLASAAAVAQPAAQTTPAAAATPAALPTTGGFIPAGQMILLGLGAVSVAAGLVIGRRKSA